MTYRFMLLALVACLLATTASAQEWETVFQAGAPGRDWRVDDGGIQFVQEANVNEPPGDPDSPVVDQQADDDFYFAGTYPDPIGTVDTEMAVERAFAGDDNDLRFHFNLPENLNPQDKFRFSFAPFNLHQDAEDPRYGIEISFNGNVIHPEQIIRPDELGQVFTTDVVTAEEVGAMAGEADNIVNVKGINYNAEGGGNWMGINYHHLEVMPIPEPGTLSMMLAGLIWAVPIMFYDRRQS